MKKAGNVKFLATFPDYVKELGRLVSNLLGNYWKAVAWNPILREKQPI